MKVLVASDKAGFELKEKLVEYLAEKHEVIDVGLKSTEDYMSFFESSNNLARALQKGEAARGILICGSGAGMCINANKYEGVFAVACESIFSAKLCRVINNANVLTMGANIVGLGMAKQMCDVFIETEFLEGEAPERAEYLQELYNNYMDFVNSTDYKA